MIDEVSIRCLIHQKEKLIIKGLTRSAIELEDTRMELRSRYRNFVLDLLRNTKQEAS